MSTTGRYDEKRLRDEALMLRSDEPEVVALFVELTDRGELQMPTDARADTLKYDTSRPPGGKDIERDAALRLLIEDGYVDHIERRGKSDYRVFASAKAMAVRSILNSLPESNRDSSSGFRPVSG
jgi:hypothetical protein